MAGAGVVRDGAGAADEGGPHLRRVRPVVLTVGRIANGTKDNIIGDSAEVAATLRIFSPAARTRGRVTGPRRPPNVTDPASVPCRTATRSGSCLPFGASVLGHR